jgi:hypothetical protein
MKLTGPDQEKPEILAATTSPLVSYWLERKRV